MQLGLAIAVALLILGVVAWPLLTAARRRHDNADDVADAASSPGRADLRAELDAVYEAIRILQMEHSLGQVADADYRAQLDEYRRQAASILRALDAQNRADE